MRHIVDKEGLNDRILIDSAGTGDWHIGHAPDKRAAATGARRGIPLGGKARQFKPADFADVDLVLALDQNNAKDLRAMSPDGAGAEKVHLLREFDPEAKGPEDVPDPYYGGPEGFEDVFDMCDRACKGLLAHLRSHHGV